MGVVDRDRGMARLIAALQDLEQPRRMTVGVHDDVGSEDHPGPSTATKIEVAAAQEFGTHVDAPLAFVRGAADDFDGEVKLAAAAERGLRSALHGSSEGGAIDRAFERVAAQLANDMKRRAPVATGSTRDAIEAKVNGIPVDLAGVG